MDLRQFIKVIADSEVGDWVQILRPTYRNRFTPRRLAKGGERSLAADQHDLHLTYRHDIRISLGFGLTEIGNYDIPPPNPFATENARTQLLDCFWDGRLAFRDRVVNVDRNRCLLPLPDTWRETQMDIPVARYGLVRLVHLIAGPPTDYEAYFSQAGMQRVNRRWPVPAPRTTGAQAGAEAGPRGLPGEQDVAGEDAGASE